MNRSPLLPGGVRGLALLLAACCTACGAPGPAPSATSAGTSPTASWTPADVRVGDAAWAYLDPEIAPADDTRVWMAFLDDALEVWVGTVDPLTGLFRSGHGRDVRLGRASAFGTRMVNGPEWGLDAEGPAVFFTAADASGTGQIWRARPPFEAPALTQLTWSGDGTVHAVANATWDPARPTTLLTGFRGRQAGPSLRWEPGTAQPFWMDEARPGQVRPLPFPNKFHRPVPGTGLAVFAAAATAEGLEAGQVYLADLEGGTIRTLSADGGEKSAPWGFHAPELGGELLVVALVDGTALAVYRDSSGGTGPWTRIATLGLPVGTLYTRVTSAEPVIGGRGFAGASFFTLEAQTAADDDSSIWLLGPGLAGRPPLARRVDGGALTGERASRRDPETLAAGPELLVYYTVTGDGPTQLRVCRTGVMR